MTLVWVLLLAAISSVMAQSCYSMDGSVLDDRYKPCYPKAGSTGSGCCMLNGTQGDNQQNDLCLDSGLCQSTSGWYAGFLYINGCTDQTGKAEGCPQLCSFMGNQYSWNVLQCEPGKFCCRAASDTDNCCGNNASMISTSHIGNILLPGSSTAINTTYNSTQNSVPTASSSTVANSTCAATTIGASDSQCANAANSTALVGGVVGGILGAALIGVITALIWALRSRKQYRSDLTSTQSTLASTQAQAVKEKTDLEHRLEDNRRNMQSIPPQYIHTPPAMPMASGYMQTAAYSPGSQAQHAPMEMPHNHGQEPSELGDPNGSRAELASESRKP